ncbi:MAG TPA: 2-amino-4-hydroxy-6-hydroxymethyldihydropteridine diphosphokinase [Dermatophilaceae bacterium]|nr:2-amino-4-hydroxy-6-hydroxymethyldihydropteridine diphosphokinase [Dermatophilaceae bacterium]
MTATGRHGVLAQEKAAGQPFVVDLDLDVDLARAAGSDDLAHTVDYAAVAASVVREVQTGSLDLIESLAAGICSAVLAGQPLVEAVRVTVHKPQAPVGVPFDDVSVTLRRERDVPVVVALGGNLGEVVPTLEAAVRELSEAVRITAVSPLYRTEPVGGALVAGQPDYLNAVVLGRTSLAPWSLLQLLHRIEAAHGRIRAARWGARTLDLDLIAYGDLESDDPQVNLPHPRAHQRAFVLAPWAAVDPLAELAGRRVADLLAEAGDDGIRLGPDWDPRW